MGTQDFPRSMQNHDCDKNAKDMQVKVRKTNPVVVKSATHRCRIQKQDVMPLLADSACSANRRRLIWPPSFIKIVSSQRVIPFSKLFLTG